jgi:hypothetical protein
VKAPGAGATALRVAAGALLAVAAIAEEPDFFARLNEAREAVSSGAGKEFFDGPFSKAFYAQYPARLSQCMKTTGVDEPAGFDMLLRLSKDGRVESAAVRPESRLATCYRELAKKDVFPAPPSAGFWVPVSIRFSTE